MQKPMKRVKYPNNNLKELLKSGDEIRAKRKRQSQQMNSPRVVKPTKLRDEPLNFEYFKKHQVSPVMTSPHSHTYTAEKGGKESDGLTVGAFDLEQKPNEPARAHINQVKKLDFSKLNLKPDFQPNSDRRFQQRAEASNNNIKSPDSL